MMSIYIKQGTLFYIYLEKLLPAVVLQVVPPVVLQPLHGHL
jgi:hypothetical protein